MKGNYAMSRLCIPRLTMSFYRGDSAIYVMVEVAVNHKSTLFVLDLRIVFRNH